ncbi:MAG: metallophosphoesterase [Acidobacteria bacterium]|nr:MAG: metallophosphoesterase [Acidobacteriota bacterium]
MRIAAVADLHCGVGDRERIRERLNALPEDADVLLIGGDLTDYGRPEELEVLISQLLRLRLPIITVLGNHDFESDAAPELLKRLRAVGIKTLDGEPYERDGVGFAGVKGFCGGFGRGELTSFGESEIKRFVHASMGESLSLERALARLRNEKRVVLLHYAPIPETAAGEAREIYPFLGSSRLADVCDRFGASAIFHGHAHHGALEGRTRGGIPVYNVAQPLLLAQKPPQAFRLVEI